MDPLFIATSKQMQIDETRPFPSEKNLQIYLNFGQLSKNLELNQIELLDVIQKGKLSELMKQKSKKISSLVAGYDKILSSIESQEL